MVYEVAPHDWHPIPIRVARMSQESRRQHLAANPESFDVVLEMAMRGSADGFPAGGSLLPDGVAAGAAEHPDSTAAVVAADVAKVAAAFEDFQRVSCTRAAQAD